MAAEHGITVHKGLEGVVADTSGVSLVDGVHGELSYRGYTIGSLIEQPFATVAALVALGRADESFGARLAAAAPLSVREQALLDSLPEALHPMLVIQGLTPLLDRSDAFAELGDAAQGFAVAAKLPTLIAGHFSRGEGRGVADPGVRAADPIAQFLAQIGAPASGVVRNAFEVAQILQIEHGFNAGTFTARVVASTLAPVESALSAAYGALYGVLHGGADQAALETADRVGTPERAAAFVDDCLARGDRVMGMGHREYKVVDPRAIHLKRLSEALTAGTTHEVTFRTLEAIERRFTERMAEQGKSLYANVEFYKGLVFRALGLPPRFFTALFAMARTFGYLGHFIECRRENRLVRPQALYVGPEVQAWPG